MPASEKRVLVANAGAGELLRVKVPSGKVDVIAAWPAACTVLAAPGRWAVVGLSVGDGPDFADLPAAGTGVIWMAVGDEHPEQRLLEGGQPGA